MVKTEDSNKETLTTAGLRYETEEIVSIDKEGNIECRRCGWTHTLQECLEYRVAMGNKELEKVARFVHITPMAQRHEGESPVDTLIRGYKTVAHNLKIMKPTDEAEVTEMMKEE